MALSRFQITYVQWFYLLSSSKFPFISTLLKTILSIILRKAKNGNFSCSPHSGYCGKAWHFHHPANTGALLKCGQTKGGQQSTHWLLAGAIWAGSNLWLTGQSLSKDKALAETPIKDAILQCQSELNFLLPQGTQVRPLFTLTREDQRLFVSFGGNCPKIYVLQNKSAVRQTGRVQGSWLCYHPWGTAKAGTKDQSRDGDPKQHLCHETYFFKCSVITHGNWKQPWIRYFTKLSPQTKIRWEGASKASFSASPCKHSNSYLGSMEQNNYQ